MRAIRYPSLAIAKIGLTLLLTLLAFQSSGINGLAAPGALPLDLQDGGDNQMLACGCSAVTHQVVLLIDDSGSMGTNDPGARRRTDAHALLDELLVPLQEKPNVRDVQVAVMHFSSGVTPGSGWNSLPDQLETIREDINAPSKVSQGTDFNGPLEEAKELFSAADGDCVRRSIVLFTDGTPENDLARRIREPELTDQFTAARSTVQDIANLEAIYIVGYRVNANYLNEGVKDHWIELVNWSGLFSSTQNTAPRLVVIASKDLSNKIEAAKEAFEKESEGFADLSPYQIAVETVDGDSARQKGEAIDLLLTLVDRSGDIAQPTLALQLKTLTQDGQETQWSEDGDRYRFSLTPALAGMNQFKLEASFFGAAGTAANTKELLHCSGTLGLLTNPDTPPDGSEIALSFVIMPPREPVDKSKPTVLPMELNSAETITDVQWSPDSPAVRTQDGKSIPATIEPADTDTPGATHREFNLIIEPAGEAEQFAVAVSGLAITGLGPVGIPPARSTIVIPEGQACVYDRAWDFWFWPLAVVLASLLALLLVFRVRDARTQKDYQVVRSDTFRIRKWRFLFMPLSILLGTLVLNRVWWCYTIPWWLFWASLLGLIVMVFPLAHFIREEKQRRWTLLALLLVAAVLVVFVSITIDRRLLWPLVILLLTVLGRWYIRPDEQPGPDADPDLTAVFSLVAIPACVPFNQSIRIPLQFDSRGAAGLAASLSWAPSAQVLPQGEAGARVAPAEAGDGAYELVIDPVPYDPDARSIRVDVRARAAREDGSPVEITGPSATIELCPPDPLAELEGIGEKVQEFLYRQGILTFKQLAGPEVDVKTINAGLDAAGWKMMDAKTWPQQAKLAAIAREFGIEEDRLNYEAYKAWLKDGIEPDEYDRDEMSRRPLPALPWNGIPQFTPLVLSLALNPSKGHRDQPITLPVQLNNAEDPVRLETVDWEASAQALPGGEQVAVTVESIDPQEGRYEIVIAPPAREAKGIRLRVQACVNGRSVEIFYGKAITVHVNPPPAANELSDLEGIEAATEKILNEKGIFTFKQLAAADHRILNKWLDDAGQKMRDAKTWPQQARLADLAWKFGSEEDQRSYLAYKSWLKAGIEPDEYELDENDRRAEALAWHGTAELTKNAYPAIFGRS